MSQKRSHPRMSKKRYLQAPLIISWSKNVLAHNWYYVDGVPDRNMMMSYLLLNRWNCRAFCFGTFGPYWWPSFESAGVTQVTTPLTFTMAQRWSAEPDIIPTNTSSDYGWGHSRWPSGKKRMTRQLLWWCLNFSMVLYEFVEASNFHLGHKNRILPITRPPKQLESKNCPFDPSHRRSCPETWHDANRCPVASSLGWNSTPKWPK